MLDLTRYNKVLIYQTAFIGDVALTFYLAQQIKNINPNVEITFVSTKTSSPIVETIDCIDNVIAYDKRNSQKGFSGIREIIAIINSYSPDVIITPHRSLRSSIISKLAKKQVSIGFQHSSMSFLYDYSIPYSKDKHEILRNFTLLSQFGISDFPDLSMLKVDITIPDSEKSLIDSLLNEYKLGQNERLIVVAPGSVWHTKKWGDDKFIDLIRKFQKNNEQVILTGSNDEVQSCEYIRTKTNVISLAGKTNLVGLLELFKRADLVVCNDSSPTHLAELVNTNVLTIYGPTIPEFGFAPRLKNSEYIQFEGLKCKPCTSHGSNKCPEGHHDCMKMIEAKSVYTIVERILFKTS